MIIQSNEYVINYYRNKKNCAHMLLAEIDSILL